MTEQELKENYSKEVYEAAITLSPEIQKKIDFPFIMPVYADERVLKSKIYGQLGDEYYKAQEAVVLRADTATRGISDTVLVLEKNTKGEYVEREYTVKFGGPCIENYPGNHVWIVKSKSGIGIYENGEKNKKYPKKKSYIAKLILAKIVDGIHVVISSIGIFFMLFLTDIRDEIFNNAFLQFILGLFIVFMYLLVVLLARKIYEKLFGKEMFKYVYHDIGIFLFVILLLLYILSNIIMIFHKIIKI